MANVIMAAHCSISSERAVRALRHPLFVDLLTMEIEAVMRRGFTMSAAVESALAVSVEELADADSEELDIDDDEFGRRAAWPGWALRRQSPRSRHGCVKVLGGNC